MRLPARLGVGGPAGLIHAETATFELRASEVANPRPGDQLTVGGQTFIIQGEPERREPDRSCGQLMCGRRKRLGA